MAANTRLEQVPGAADLLLGISVYREAVDLNAILFQTGQPDPAAEDIPDWQAASQRIAKILAAAAITIDESFDLASVPAAVRARLAPYLAELDRRPVPPYRPVPGLREQVAACQAASLLTISGGEGQEPRFFVHRWTATELAGRAAREQDPRLAGVHRHAAGYWRWRVRVWPQDETANVHDRLEARHHLLQASDTEQAGEVTEGICLQLQTWGAWDQEAALIHDTLARLPAGSPRQAAYIHHLGMLAQARGDYDEAARQYQRALDIFERLGDQAGMATVYHQLGMIAQARGDYDEAARQYQRSLGARERLGDQAGMADSYGQLGILAQDRGDYDEAARQYQRALDIFERLGYQAKMATVYHQLGLIAQARGDYDETARQYQRALSISERLGDHAGMARVYHNLGVLAHYRGDYDEAARQYQRALSISERLGDQVGMAGGYHQLGVLAHERGDYDEAARQHHRALQIRERLGDQASLATTYSQLGILEADRGRPPAAAIGWHVKALAIRLRLGVPEAVINLRRLAACRRELGTEPFTGLLTQAASHSDLTERITSLLDRVDAAEGGTA